MTQKLRPGVPIWGAAPAVREGRYALVRGDIPREVRSLGQVTSGGHRSHIVTVVQADAAGLSYPFVAAWIILRLRAAAKANRPTGTVVDALKGAGIDCIAVDGFAHNHVFVPYQRIESALSVLATVYREDSLH
jgi:hypothetical protein